MKRKIETKEKQVVNCSFHRREVLLDECDTCLWLDSKYAHNIKCFIDNITH